MKKILPLFFFIVFSAGVFAQSISFGVRGGVTFAHQEIKSGLPYYQLNTSPITTFCAGGFANVSYGAFSVQPGIFLNGQGGETKGRYFPPLQGQSTYWLSDIKSRLYYAEVPVDVVYHLPAPFNRIYVGVGPYIAMGLFGNASDIESTVYPNNPTQNFTMNIAEKVSFGSDGYRLLQFGANAIAGVRFRNRWQFNIGYDLGLTSVNHNNPRFVNIRDDQFTVSAGCFFK